MDVAGFGIHRQLRGVQVDLSVIRVSQEEKVAAIRTIGAYAPSEHQHDIVMALGLDSEFRP